MRKLIAAAFALAGCVSAHAQCGQPAFPDAPCPQQGVIQAYGGGSGIIATLADPWTWPGYGSGQSLNYVYSVPIGDPSSNLGKTLTLTFNLHSSGPCGEDCVTGSPVDGQGSGVPATVYLFIWEVGDNGQATMRWWCDAGLPLAYGDNQTLGCPLLPMYWSDVFGQVGTFDGGGSFETAVANPWAMGVTFGGEFFGHGVYQTAPGTVTFTVTGWSIE